MTGEIEELHKKSSDLKEAMELIYDDPEMVQLWDMLQKVLNGDESYDLSPTERLEYQAVGTLYFKALKAISKEDNEELLEALGKNTSPMGRIMDMAAHLEKIRQIGKKRAESNPNKNSTGWDEVEYTAKNDDTTVQFKKKKNAPPIDLDDLKDYEE